LLLDICQLGLQRFNGVALNEAVEKVSSSAHRAVNRMEYQ